MATWTEFTQQAPQFAAFGAQRLGGNQVGYLATLRPDGGPRVHPVTPVLGKQLFLFMEPTSPKGFDLQRDPRFSLHCAVENSDGGEGEFYVRGTAQLTQSAELRAKAMKAATYAPADRYILFVLNIDFAFMNIYADGKSNPQRWEAK